MSLLPGTPGAQVDPEMTTPPQAIPGHQYPSSREKAGLGPVVVAPATGTPGPKAATAPRSESRTPTSQPLAWRDPAHLAGRPRSKRCSLILATPKPFERPN